MKKLFAFAAAALCSAAIFADAPANIPSDEVLNAYRAEGANVLVGFYTTAEVCNDIVFVGSYNNWSANAADCTPFEAVEGYDNWYVVSITDASADIQGKPVQLKSDGSFSWDYQVGDDVELYRGTMTIEPGYSGEVNLKEYGTNAPVVYGASKWKLGNNPCVTVPTHDYTVILTAPFCADAEGTYFDPAIIGDFNGWGEGVAMQYDGITDTYSYTFNDEENHQFKFKATTDTDWTNQIQLYDAENDNWYDNPNLILGTNTTIILDYSAGRYTLCVEETAVEQNFDAEKAVKKIVNGQLILVKGAKRFNVLGAQF